MHSRRMRSMPEEQGAVRSTTTLHALHQARLARQMRELASPEERESQERAATVEKEVVAIYTTKCCKRKRIE